MRSIALQIRELPSISAEKFTDGCMFFKLNSALFLSSCEDPAADTDEHCKLDGSKLFFTGATKLGNLFIMTYFINRQDQIIMKAQSGKFSSRSI